MYASAAVPVHAKQAFDQNALHRGLQFIRAVALRTCYTNYCDEATLNM
jgi:hypothetical protein